MSELENRVKPIVLRLLDNAGTNLTVEEQTTLAAWSAKNAMVFEHFESGNRGSFPTANAMPFESRLMLRSLLADRFKLVVHDETRDSPIYAFVMARNDVKLGPQMKRTSDDYESVLAERRAAARARGPGPFTVTAPPTGERPVCTFDGSALASSRTYRLEGIASQFSPFAGPTVEISGEIKPPSSSTPGGGAGESAPTLLVELVQKIASTCS